MLDWLRCVPPGAGLARSRRWARRRLRLFLPPEEVARHLVSGSDDVGLRVLAGYSDRDLVTMHHGLGQYVRNAYGLWDGRNPYTTARLRGVPPDSTWDSPWHPDNASVRILRLARDEARRRAGGWGASAGLPNRG